MKKHSDTLLPLNWTLAERLARLQFGSNVEARLRDKREDVFYWEVRFNKRVHANGNTHGLQAALAEIDRAALALLYDVESLTQDQLVDWEDRLDTEHYEATALLEQS